MRPAPRAALYAVINVAVGGCVGAAWDRASGVATLVWGLAAVALIAALFDYGRYRRDRP